MELAIDQQNLFINFYLHRWGSAAGTSIFVFVLLKCFGKKCRQKKNHTFIIIKRSSM